MAQCTSQDDLEVRTAAMLALTARDQSGESDAFCLRLRETLGAIEQESARTLAAQLAERDREHAEDVRVRGLELDDLLNTNAALAGVIDEMNASEMNAVTSTLAAARAEAEGLGTRCAGQIAELKEGHRRNVEEMNERHKQKMAKLNAALEQKRKDRCATLAELDSSIKHEEHELQAQFDKVKHLVTLSLQQQEAKKRAS